MEKSYGLDKGKLLYAGFGKRLCAYLIDQSIIQGGSLLLLAPFVMERVEKIWDSLITLIAGSAHMTIPATDTLLSPDSLPPGVAEILTSLTVLSVIFLTVMAGIGLCYGTLMEASPSGATLGKRYCGLRVTTETGERIGYGVAFLRNLGINVFTAVALFDTLIGLIVLPVFLTPLFLKRRQTLCDLAVHAVVLRLK